MRREQFPWKYIRWISLLFAAIATIIIGIEINYYSVFYYLLVCIILI